MLISKRKLNYEDFDQIVERKTKIAEMKVPYGRIYRIPQELITVKMAVKQELVKDAETEEEEPEAQTFTIDSGIYEADYAHYELKDPDGNKVAEANYNINYDNNEITLTDDLASGDYDFYYLGQQGNFEIRCKSPDRISSEETVELIGNEINVAHQIDQNKEGSGFIPSKKTYLPEHFKLQIWVESDKKIEFETDVTTIEIKSEETTMDRFLRQLQEEDPEAVKDDIAKYVLDRWQRR